MALFVIVLVILVQHVLCAPVRTELCCCGCTEEPCPLVGPSCPAPRAPCNTSVKTVKCSALQRLFEISKHKIFDEDSTDRTTSMAMPVPNLNEHKSVELLPSLDVRELQSMKNDILAMSTRNKTKSGHYNKMTRMMGEMEEMLQLMREEMSTQKGKVLEEAGTLVNIDSTLHAPTIRAARLKRAETDNCNDEKLRKLIKENIKKDAKTSKRQIQKAANKELGGHFNVICSPCEISFVVASQKYCDGFKDEVACFAFLQPPSKLKLEED